MMVESLGSERKAACIVLAVCPQDLLLSYENGQNV